MICLGNPFALNCIGIEIKKKICGTAFSFLFSAETKTTSQNSVVFQCLYTQWHNSFRYTQPLNYSKSSNFFLSLFNRLKVV